MDRQKREDIIKRIQEETVTMQREQYERFIPTVRDSRETLRNLILASGGIATGSLVVLGSSVPSDSSLITIGIIIMFIQMILGFGYLLHVQNLAAENYFSLRKRTVIPRGRVLNQYLELQEGKITEKEFDESILELARSERKERYEINLEVLNKDEKTDNWDLIFIGLLSLGIVLIVIGFISPYL